MSPRRISAEHVWVRGCGVLALIAVLAVLTLVPVQADTAPPRLTSRSRPAATALTTLEVGKAVKTAAGQRQRFALADGSLVYVNENTSLRLDEARRLTLQSGVIYVEAAGDAPLVVKTKQREMSGRDVHFGVGQGNETAIMVTRGRLNVSGLEAPLRARQHLFANGKPSLAENVTRSVDWTRELMGDTPLVPANPHAGGAIVASARAGQPAKLSLRKYHVDVHVEDGFARTTIDQTYFNHEADRLEGTFHFPLPADASLCRLAMYVDGKRMEGGMAERDHARSVYESIRYQQRDPALLEWVDGTTFKMRVFPLEARQEKRLILSYTQKLPSRNQNLEYRFPAGHSLGVVADWSVQVRFKNAAARWWGWNCASHALKTQQQGNDLLLTAADKNVKLDRDLVLSLYEMPFATPEEDRSIAERSPFATAELDGAKYLMVRHRPALTGQAERPHRDWIFLCETSADREPLLARTQIEMIRSLLHRAEPDDTFLVVGANTRLRTMGESGWLTPGTALRPVTPANIQTAVEFLENAHLIGALDLGRALAEVEPYLKAAQNPHLVHLGTGIAAMGERRDDVLAKKIPDGVRYVGIGVGRRWSRGFMKAAAERTGGYFTQVNPDEPISWRAFDLANTLDMPRLLNVQVTDPTGKVQFLTHTSLLAQGEEICAVARSEGALPESVVITGQLGKEPWRHTLSVKDVRRGADHLPRTWAKLEIDRLLADISRDPKTIKQQVIDLSKQMYVMTPFTSLLVLENEAMYDQYKVDRGRKDHWAMYACPDQVPVVYEPLPGMPASVKEQVEKPKPTPEQVLHSIQVRGARQEAHPADPALSRLGQIFIAGNRVTGSNVIRRMISTHAFDLAGLVDLDDPSNLAIPPHGGFSNIPAGARPASFISGGERMEAYLGRMPVLDAFAFVTERMEDKYSYFGPSVIDGLTPAIIKDFEYDAALKHPQFARARSWPLNNTEDLRAIGKDTLITVDETRTLLFASSGMKNILGYRRIEFEELRSEVLVTRGAGRNADLGERLVYRRPSYRNNDRIFFDLVSYAPGMNTAWPDMQALVEAETIPNPAVAPGKIEAAARKLIEQARGAGWQSYEIETGWTIHFDGAGRYRWERTLFPGLREQVFCDGQTLWHLYPDLGIGARRTVSRFHHSAFAGMVPWLLPKPEDLARGVDLISVDARTVAIVPADEKDGKGKRLHLVFDNGRLVERQLVEMPAKKILARQTLADDGTIRLLDADGKEVAVRKCSLRPAQAPSLKPDVKQLVVLPLPYRTPDHVREVLAERQIRLEDRPTDEALPLFAAEFAAGNAAEAFKVFQAHFHTRNQRQLGFYVLLAGCGHNLDGEPADVLAEHPNEPLAQYLALYSSPVLRKHASQWAVGVGQWGDGFLRHLAVTHALLQRWQNPRPFTPAERERAVDYIRKHQGTLFSWSLLTLMQDRAQAEADEDKDVRADFAALAELFGLFDKTAGLAYAARYEQARCLANAGKPGPARERFRALYTATVKDGTLPLIDGRFRAILLNGQAGDSWGEMIRSTAAHFIKEKQRLAVLALAWQCWQLGDGPLANHLLQMALADITDAKQRLDLTLAGIGFLQKTGQLPEADQLLAGLLADPKHAESPALWRLGAELAAGREMTVRERHCLEKALAAEYRHLPDIINVEAVRQDYRSLLEHYQNLAEAMVSLGVPPPPDFLARVVSTADRWRALDRDADDPCRLTAKILQTLGRRELAWDYLTSPIGMKPGDAEPWSSLAWSLQRKGELDLADRAFASAFEMESTNAQYLWDRAQNLRQAGKYPEAQQLLKQLADGEWQPRFLGLKTQAQWQIGGK